MVVLVDSNNFREYLILNTRIIQESRPINFVSVNNNTSFGYCLLISIMYLSVVASDGTRRIRGVGCL
jgi:hypothetical protein